MEKNNKLILAAIVAVAVIAIIIAAAVSSKPAGSGSSISDNKQSEVELVTEEPRVTPTFVYFITQADATTAEFMATVEKLRAEYDGKINFDLRDLDANPGEAENFPLVVGQTPAVIMLDTSNAPCAFELANPGEDALRAAIEKALAQ